MSVEENKALVRRFYDEVWNRATSPSPTSSLPRTTCGMISGPAQFPQAGGPAASWPSRSRWRGGDRASRVPSE
jgi:hypothetical protein